jgi:hypothetical protein
MNSSLNPSLKPPRPSAHQDTARPTKRSLSKARQRLVEVMQEMGFGRIEGLVVRQGEPILEPVPRVVLEIKFGGENGPRPERSATDFPLKARVTELFREFDRLGDLTVEILEVKHGLPFRMTLVEPA